MIEEVGIVTRVEGQNAWVDVAVKSTCDGCQANNHCGTGVVAKAFSHKTNSLLLETKQILEVGQRVKVGVAEQALLKTSALVYLVPLITFLISAILCQRWLMPILDTDNELFLILFSLLITAFSFWTIAALLKRKSHWNLQPKLLAVLPSTKQIDILSLE